MESPKNDINYIKKNFAKEYKLLSDYLSKNKLVSFWLSPKMAGRSTYEGYLMELFPNRFKLISAGDIVRNWQAEIEKNAEDVKKKLKEMLQTDGERAFNELSKSDVKTLVSDEIFLKLLKAEIQNSVRVKPFTGFNPNQNALKALEGSTLFGNQSLIIDGFPRTEKQVEQAIAITAGLKKEYQPIAITLQVSNSVLNLRMSSRRVCPNCGKVGNLLTLLNSNIEYDKENDEFFLSCTFCKTKMVKKKTDTSIKDMLERRTREEQVSKQLVKKFKALGFLGLNVVTDIKVNNFTGTDEQLNPAYNFVHHKKGLIKTTKIRQESINDDGTKVYNYHPRYAVGLILRAISSKL